MSPPLELDAYLLCATPRSGSTLLCGLLESSGVAGHPASYFNRDSLQAYADEWGLLRPQGGRIDDAFVQAALNAGRTENGVFGGRLMGDTRPQLLDDLAVVAARTAEVPPVTDLDRLTQHLGRLRFVHLRRVDVLAQAVSWARSLQTHFWHPGEEVAPGGHDPHYDEDLINRLIARITGLEHDWAVWFADQGVVPYEVTYEELAADPPATARGVLDWLGLSPGRPLETRHRRQADGLNEDWICRYRAR